MLEQYSPVLVFISFGILCGLIPISISTLVHRKRPSAVKSAPYECGFEPFENARMQFDIRFYLVAILFVIFDLEMAFLFPWAVIFKKISFEAFLAMGIFMTILAVGFIYEWKKGALEWE